MGATLFIFGGLPGTGKSTLSSALARSLSGVYIRIDTIEQTMREGGLIEVGETGYIAGYRLAQDNLRLGNSVVSDSVNPIRATRDAWTDVARQAGVPYVEIEIICSDLDEHRKRVESRLADIVGLKLPDWKQVMDRRYDRWISEHLVLDTAGRTTYESISDLFAILNNRVVSDG